MAAVAVAGTLAVAAAHISSAVAAGCTWAAERPWVARTLPPHQRRVQASRPQHQGRVQASRPLRRQLMLARAPAGPADGRHGTAAGTAASITAASGPALPPAPWSVAPSLLAPTPIMAVRTIIMDRITMATTPITTQVPRWRSYRVAAATPAIAHSAIGPTTRPPA